ncbi:hypothetical protein ACLOJK_037393 [Asimina triloba]
MRWNNELPEVRSVALEELLCVQRAVVEFFQSHSLKWHSMKGAFFRWCKSLPLSGVLAASPRGGPEGRQYGEASGSSTDARPSTEGSPKLIPRRLDHRTMGRGAPEEEEASANLQAGLELSREEARHSSLIVASPEASMEPSPLVLASSSVPVADVEVDITSPRPAFEREPFEASGREGTEVRTVEEQGPLSCSGAGLGEAGAPVRHGALGSTFGEASLCPSDD